ncbi:MAG TPA: glycine zipper 2TM domain-containing protein [Candidatus Competibacter sp.]|nr:glycine zipper 2TM domain-containing protein [Candidatus Competibacter sp.]
MRSKTTAIVAVVLGAVVALSGCASSMSGRAYSRDQVAQAQDVQLGYVENIRQIVIEGTRSGVGTMSGAMLGGLAGSNVGKGTGQVAGAIGGAVLGGLIGSSIEEDATRQPGLEILVELDGGRMVAVSQAADEPFYPGDRVKVLTGYDGTTRVAHYY